MRLKGGGCGMRWVPRPVRAEVLRGLNKGASFGACGTFGEPLGDLWVPLGHQWAPVGHQCDRSGDTECKSAKNVNVSLVALGFWRTQGSTNGSF